MTDAQTPDSSAAADTVTPGTAWEEMAAGNARFVAGTPEHPHQDADRRAELAGGQKPIAALFGCADSRLGAEIIFDVGLGDLFVVRNAGQVVGDTVIGSLEYAVGVLGIPLIVVLGHDSCGAVAAAIQSIDADSEPQSFHLQRVIDMIVPSVKRAHRALSAGETAASGGAAGGVGTAGELRVLDPREVGRLHIEASVGALLERSVLISESVASGTLAVVGANYDLANGRVDVHTVVGVL